MPPVVLNALVSYADLSAPVILSGDDDLSSFDEKPMRIPIGTTLTAIETTEVTIICQARGFPEPTLVWRQDGVEIDKSFEERGVFVEALQGGGSSLVIRGKPEDFDSAVFGCSARNAAGNVAKFSVVKFLGWL